MILAARWISAQWHSRGSITLKYFVAPTACFTAQTRWPAWLAWRRRAEQPKCPSFLTLLMGELLEHTGRKAILPARGVALITSPVWRGLTPQTAFLTADFTTVHSREILAGLQRQATVFG